MLAQNLVPGDVPAFCGGFCQRSQLLLQAAGQHCQTHDLDKADVLLLDVVLVRMGVEHTQRMLRSTDVAPQHQIQLIVLPPATGDGGDGVVRLPIREGNHSHALVGVAAPAGENLVSQIRNPVRIAASQPDDAHGPLHNSGIYILISPEGQCLFHSSRFHGKAIVTALKMLVAQDGAAHNGQIGVGAHKVVGEHPDEVQQLLEGGLVDLHGDVLRIEDNAVLVVVDIGGVLQAPVRAANLDGDDPVVGPGRVVHPSGVALVLPAQLALGVGGLGGIFCRGNGLGVLFRLAEVDGDVHFPVLAGVFPTHILGDAVAADVVGVAAEFVIPVRSRLGALGILLPEGTDDFPGHGGHRAHDPGVEDIPGGDAIVAQAVCHGIIQHSGQNFLQILRLRLVRGGVVLLVENVQQPVGEHLMVARLGKAGIHGVGHQRVDTGFDVHACTSISTPP